MILRNVFLAYVAATLVTVISLGGARATVLYEVLPAGSYNTGAVSASGDRTPFEDFTLTDAATVTSISWIGRFSNPGDQFRIGFYESAGQPFPFTAPTETPFFEVTSTASDAISPFAPFNLARDYSLDLGAGVSLDADTTYFLSIKNLDAPFWQWQNDPDGLAFIRFDDGREIFTNAVLFFTLEGDLANDETVALAGPPVPALLTLGLAGLCIARLRANRGKHRRRVSSRPASPTA